MLGPRAPVSSVLAPSLAGCPAARLRRLRGQGHPDSLQRFGCSRLQFSPAGARQGQKVGSCRVISMYCTLQRTGTRPGLSMWALRGAEGPHRGDVSHVDHQIADPDRLPGASWRADARKDRRPGIAVSDLAPALADGVSLGVRRGGDPQRGRRRLVRLGAAAGGISPAGQGRCCSWAATTSRRQGPWRSLLRTRLARGWWSVFSPDVAGLLIVGPRRPGRITRSGRRIRATHVLPRVWWDDAGKGIRRWRSADVYCAPNVGGESFGHRPGGGAGGRHPGGGQRTLDAFPPACYATASGGSLVSGSGPPKFRPPALADALIAVLQDDGAAGTLRGGPVLRVVRRYDWSVVASQIMAGIRGRSPGRGSRFRWPADDVAGWWPSWLLVLVVVVTFCWRPGAFPRGHPGWTG